MSRPTLIQGRSGWWIDWPGVVMLGPYRTQAAALAVLTALEQGVRA